MNLSCSHRLTNSELSKVKSFFGEWETKASMANTGSEILKLQLEFNQSALAFFSKVLSKANILNFKRETFRKALFKTSPNRTFPNPFQSSFASETWREY